MRTNAPVFHTRSRGDGAARGRRASGLAHHLVLWLLALGGFTPAARALWLTQSVTLKPGWNAVFLHVDASHATMDALVGAVPANPIAEVWLWQPAPATLQFVTSPQLPTGGGSQWASWVRPLGPSSALQRLVGNAAYLVHNTNTTAFVWAIQGRPVPPRYQWTSSGLNFLGFPTPAAAAPDFDSYLLPAPPFHSTAEIFRYPGGELGPTNPVAVPAPLFRHTLVQRGEAFWVRSGTNGAWFNRYFGPVAVELQNSGGVQFADTLGVYRVRLKNLTATARTVALSLLASENPPAGQPVVFGPPPLLVRGALNPTNLTYAHTALTSAHSFTLTAQGQPGSEADVVLGLNRAAMTGAAGALYAGVLRFTDTGGLEQIDVPVTATVGDTAGLWVGAAAVTSVNQYLKTYATAATTNDVPTPSSFWTPHPAAGNRRWMSLASSADGTHLLAAASAGFLYTSTDAGMTWTGRLTDAPRAWQPVASAADGMKLVAATYLGPIFTSVDAGVTWTPQAAAGNRNWNGVASSADGTKLVAVVGGGQIYTSTDAGATWTPRANNRSWMAVAASTDGTKLVAAVQNGQLYTSTDSGGTWTARDAQRLWSSVASSADGMKLVAAATYNATPGQIYTSVDAGVTWTPRESDRLWRALASSADGTKLLAAAQSGQLYRSTDSGVNWTAQESTRNWRTVASSADGEKLVAGQFASAATSPGLLYTSDGTATTYERDAATGRIIARSPGGAPYVVTRVNTASGAVARSMPLRLILHTDTTNTHLLQRVYHGLNPGTNYVNATQELFLDPRQLATARRISAVHLPASPTNTFWKFTGPLQAGTVITATVRLGHGDHASNPFLHTYHPDHDNLDAKFTQPLATGFESYTITRVISLTLTPPANDFASLTSSGQTRTGVYAETVTLAGKGAESRSFGTQGTFTLNRINRIGTLTTQ